MPYIHFFTVLAEHIKVIAVNGGYPFLFLSTALEGIPLVGALVPGHVAIVASGFLARIHILNIWLVLMLSSSGAVIGDYVGFRLGRKYGISFIDRLRPYFFITDEHIEKARALLTAHTGKSLVIGRFNPVTRALTPFLVGCSTVSHRRFWLFNVIGGVSWVVVSVAVGYVFGAGYHFASGYIGKFALFAVIVAFVIVWGYKFVNARFHAFKKYELFVLILNIISLYTLARTIQDAWAPQSFMANFDVYTNIFMDTLAQGHWIFVTLALWATTLGSTVVTGGLGIGIGILLALRRRWRSAAIMLLSVLSTGFIVALLKAFFARLRPDNALISIIGDPSFPSGHAALAAAFFVIVAYLLARHIHSWVAREVVIVLSVLAVIAIGLSRVVLNVHWASDVIAGWSLGIFMATASILFVRYVGALVVKRG